MAIIFIASGSGWAFVVCVISILTIRPTAGGFHSSGPWGCFFWSLFGFALAIFVFPIFAPTTSLSIFLVGGFSLTITYKASPLRSKQMEQIVNKNKDGYRKMKVTIITLF